MNWYEENERRTVKTLMGPECTRCAEGVLWVQGNQWNSLWVQGALAKSKTQWFDGRDKWGVWDWSQDVNEYRTREYHYNYSYLYSTEGHSMSHRIMEPGEL